MSDIILNNDTQRYIDMFYTPAISSYEFLKGFFAALYRKGETRISRDLSGFFYQLKWKPKYKDILLEIKFKNNGVFMYSNELEDDILMLQNMGLLGKTNPSFGIILINYDDSIATETLESYPKDQLSLIEEIADLYKQENSH